MTPISSGRLVDDLLGNSSRLLVLDSPGVRRLELAEEAAGTDIALAHDLVRLFDLHAQCRPRLLRKRHATASRYNLSARL